MAHLEKLHRAYEGYVQANRYMSLYEPDSGHFTPEHIQELTSMAHQIMEIRLENLPRISPNVFVPLCRELQKATVVELSGYWTPSAACIKVLEENKNLQKCTLGTKNYIRIDGQGFVEKT
ncbi:MAG: hypothetical protein Q8K75_10940 [Chlamydiales bacterium]|nr:hypothetical protein [Chlamydiales bacterium]